VRTVRAWLLRAGYPLEYEAARLLRAASFTVRQGRSYLDPGENKVREVDVVASLRGSHDVEVSLVVECKRTVRTAWVVLTHESPLRAADVLASTISTRHAREVLVERANTRNQGIPPFLEVEVRHGFSVVQAHRAAEDDRPEQPFKAMSQVTAAAIATISRDEFGMKLAWPVVVIDGPLYEVTATDSGDDVAPTDYARVMWHGAVAGQPVVVDIVRRPALEQYAARAYQGLRSVQNVLGEQTRL
jgi:hypothetical protein